MDIIKAISLLATMALLYAGTQAHAERSESGANPKQWFTLEGKPLSAVEANHQKGKFLQCDVVEDVTNERTGKTTIKK